VVSQSVSFVSGGCVAGWVVCVGSFLHSLLSAAVRPLGGFEAGTVLSLIPLWGGRRRSHALSSRLSVSPVVGDRRVKRCMSAVRMQ
jgi:hypothetical protein